MHRHVPDFQCLGILGEKVPQHFLLFQGFFQRHPHFKRDHLGQLVTQAVGLVLHPGDVAHDSLRRHSAKGNDLGDGFPAVGIGDIVDHPVAPIHTEVDVEVGHGHPLRIEKAFEQQVVLQRIEIGDLQRIGHQRAGTGATARPHGNIVLLGPANEVHHDQEVAGETHLDDGIQLEIEPRAIFRLPLVEAVARRVEKPRQALVQPLVRQLPKIGIHSQTGGHRIVREIGLAQFQHQVAAPGYLHGVLQGLRYVGKQLCHFRR